MKLQMHLSRREMDTNGMKCFIEAFRVAAIHKSRGEHFPSTYTSLTQYQYQLPDLQFINHFQSCEVYLIATELNSAEQALRRMVSVISCSMEKVSIKLNTLHTPCKHQDTKKLCLSLHNRSDIKGTFVTCIMEKLHQHLCKHIKG